MILLKNYSVINDKLQQLMKKCLSNYYVMTMAVRLLIVAIAYGIYVKSK